MVDNTIVHYKTIMTNSKINLYIQWRKSKQNILILITITWVYFAWKIKLIFSLSGLSTYDVYNNYWIAYLSTILE